MAQSNMTIANQTFPAFRTSLNQALQAVATTSSGITSPTTTFGSQLWADTSAANTLLRVRNRLNNNWATIGTLNESNNTFTVVSTDSATNATNSTNVTVTADNATNANRFITFVDAQTGNIGVKTDLQLTYNPSTNILGTSISGNSNTATSATSATTAGSCTGNSVTATNLSTTRSNWLTNGTVSAVVGQLAWRNNGNNSTVFDASAFRSPSYISGTNDLTNRKDAATAWQDGYPTLMGWNGTTTYGVRVDSARLSDLATSATSAGSATDSTNIDVLTDNTFSGSVHLLFSRTGSGLQRVRSDDALLYNPNTNTLTVTNITGTITNATNAVTAGSCTGNSVTATSATTATNANNIAVALDTNTSTSVERNVLFVSGTTGNQSVFTDSGLVYNQQLNRLTATTFKGALEGNASTATSATTAGTATSATTATNTTNVNLTADNAGTTARPLVFASASTGNQPLFTDTGLTYQPSTNTLTASIFVGSLTGNAATATSTTTQPTGTNNTTCASTAFVQTAVTQALQSIYPVGSIYINASTSTNPGTLLGFGTWVSFGAGRVPVGFSSADALFNAAEKTGGSKDAIVVSHTHTGTTASAGAHNHTVGLPVANSSGLDKIEVAGGDIGTYTYTTSTAGAHDHTFTTASAGSSGTNANLQPYITVYMWKRTS